VLQCVAVCCSALQCVAVRCSALQCVAVRCSALQCVAVRCGVLQRVAVCCSALQCAAVRCSVLQCVAVCCSVLTRTTSFKSRIYGYFTPTFECACIARQSNLSNIGSTGMCYSLLLNMHVLCISIIFQKSALLGMLKGGEDA